VRTVAIIQAHMGSSRLPGKVLMDVAGQSMLERVVRRSQRCTGLDAVVVATSDLPGDDVIVEACRKMGVAVYRGSDEDVLDRFRGAAAAVAADLCVRINSDCPLIDPGVSDHVIHRFKQADPPVDYASNKIHPSYPLGLDTEVFTLAALERAWRLARQPYQRSHVTVYIYQHPGEFRLLSIRDEVDRSDWRWTVDTWEDLEFVRQVYLRLGADGEFTWRDVVGLLEREPHLHEINSHVRGKVLHEG